MNPFLKFLSLFLVIPMLISCAGKKITPGESSKVSKGPVTVWASWVKDKGKKYDLQFHIGNEGDKDMIVQLADMSCRKGGSTGDLRHTFFNTGERTIDIRVGRSKSMVMVCNLGAKTQGAYVIAIAKVYENPGGDGVTRGKVLANDVEWHLNLAP